MSPSLARPPGACDWAEFARQDAQASLADTAVRRSGARPVISARVAAISALLFVADPIGIAAPGNTDEYDSEAQTIARGLEHTMPPDEVLDLVHATFVAWFTPEVAGRRSRYAAIADRIWADRPAWRDGPGAG